MPVDYTITIMPQTRNLGAAGGGGNAGGNAASTLFSQLPMGTAGFDDVLDFLSVQKDEPFVKSVAFLPWLPVPASGAAALNTAVAAPKDLISAAACLGGRLASTAATRNAWHTADPLTSRLTLAAINQQAAAMKSFSAFTTTFTDPEFYRQSVVEMLSKQPNLSALELDDQALERPTPFDTPGVPAPTAVRNRGRGRGAGQGGANAPPPIQPVPGPNELKWLTLSRISDLVDGGTPLPMERLLRLWTLLPGRCDDAERRDARSLMRGNAEELRGGVANLTSVGQPSDARLGRSLRAFCETALIFPLPKFRLDALSFNEVAVELSDAMAYAQGSASDGARALSRRLMFSGRDYVHMCALLGELTSADERVLQLERVSTLACPGRHAQALHLRLTEINAYIADRAALITAGRNVGKSSE